MRLFRVERISGMGLVEPVAEGVELRDIVGVIAVDLQDHPDGRYVVSVMKAMKENESR